MQSAPVLYYGAVLRIVSPRSFIAVLSLINSVFSFLCVLEPFIKNYYTRGKGSANQDGQSKNPAPSPPTLPRTS